MLKLLKNIRSEREIHSIESFDIFNLFEKFRSSFGKRGKKKIVSGCERWRFAIKKKGKRKKGVQRRYSAKFQPSWTWKALCPGFETNHSGWPLHKEIYITLWKQKALRAKSFSMRDQVIFIGSAEHFVWTTKWYLMPASPAYHAL